MRSEREGLAGWRPNISVDSDITKAAAALLLHVLVDSRCRPIIICCMGPVSIRAQRPSAFSNSSFANEKTPTRYFDQRTRENVLMRFAIAGLLSQDPS